MRLLCGRFWIMHTESLDWFWGVMVNGLSHGGLGWLLREWGANDTRAVNSKKKKKVERESLYLRVFMGWASPNPGRHRPKALNLGPINNWAGLGLSGRNQSSVQPDLELGQTWICPAQPWTLLPISCALSLLKQHLYSPHFWAHFWAPMTCSTIGSESKGLVTTYFMVYILIMIYLLDLKMHPSFKPGQIYWYGSQPPIWAPSSHPDPPRATSPRSRAVKGPVPCQARVWPYPTYTQWALAKDKPLEDLN